LARICGVAIPAVASPQAVLANQPYGACLRSLVADLLGNTTRTPGARLENASLRTLFL